MEAVLMYNGTPVRTSSDQNSYSFLEYKLALSGVLLSFTLSENSKKYKFYNDADLLPIHQPKPKQYLTKDARRYWGAGYYQVEAFKQYKNDEISLGELVSRDSAGVSKYAFELTYGNKPVWGLEYAKKGDIVTVRRLDPIPHDVSLWDNYKLVNYYNLKEYIFKLNYDDEDSDYPPRYKNTSHIPPVDTNPDSDSYSIINDIIESYTERSTWFFYMKNFTELYQHWNLPDEYFQSQDEALNQLQELKNPKHLSNKKLSKLITRIAFRTSQITDEILEKIAIEPILYIQQTYYHYIIRNEKDEFDNYIYDNTQGDETLAQEYEALTQIDKLIASLLRSWGRLSTGNILGVTYPQTIDFEPIFSETIDYNGILTYYNSLDKFYRKLFAIVEEKEFPPYYYVPYNDYDPIAYYTPQEDSERRIRILASILPDGSFSVFSYEERIKIIDPFLTQEYIQEVDQRTIINIIYSINTATDAQLFLDYLLKIKPGSADINFKLLYDLLDDARIERYVIANWFVDRQTNKKHFIYAVYNLWKLTSYNVYHIPTGTIPDGNGLNPNAYFLNEGSKYYIEYNADGSVKKESEAILEFESTTELTSTVYISFLSGTSRYFEPSDALDKEVMTMYEIKGDSFQTSNSIFPIETENERNEFAKYHIYQPITLVGYKADLELSIPNLKPIPAFLFYYGVQFDKIKDFDTAFNFVAELTLEVVLFFTFGGLGALRHLRHLKHANKVGAAFRNVLAADEAVVVWRGLSAGVEVVLTLPASVLYSTSQLIANSTNDQATHNTYKALGRFFLVIIFASAGGAIYSARRASKSADEVIEGVVDLTDNNIAHGIDTEVIDILYTIKNTTTVSKTFFKNRIASLTDVALGGEPNHMIDLFDAMTDVQKNQFWQHFGNRVGDATTNPDNWGEFDLYFWQLMNKTESGVNVASVSAARMRAWIDAPTGYRHLIRDIKYLDEVVHLSIRDREAFDHLSLFANRPKTGTPSTSFNITGGHMHDLVFDGSHGTDLFVSPGIEILDPNFAHTINPGNTSQKMIDYISNTQNNTNIATILSNGNSKVFKYTKDVKPGGHLIHKQILIKRQGVAATDLNNQFVLNGVVYKPKALQTQINPNWDELDVIYQYAHALRNKVEKPAQLKYKISGHHGSTNPWFERVYESKLLDGTEVIIKHVNYHRYNLQSTFDNHYPYFQLEF